MINTSTIKINEDWKPLEYFQNGNGYAILSHRWQGSEISFQEMRRGVPKESPSFKKILDSCAKARSLGYEWIWVDTCCINKESQTELVESLNSMFQWYLQASVCFGYLFDVEIGGLDGLDSSKEPGIFRRRLSEKYKASEWFSRGKVLLVEAYLSVL